MSPDIDPRGLPVYGADRFEAGHVKDLWVDRCEMMFRYVEVSLHSGDTVLLPMTFSRINRRGVFVSSILAEQFAHVPKTKSDVQITLLEEEKITAYYGAGTLYAMPERQEPLF
jgi:photosynthetic reaction center H subunit